MNVLEQCTPGEWAIVRELPGVTYIMSRDERGVFHTPICQLSEGSYNKDHKANAQLVAAAKELYAALLAAKEAMLSMGHAIRYLDENNEYLESWTQDGGYINSLEWSQIENALTKAEGGNP